MGTLAHKFYVYLTGLSHEGRPLFLSCLWYIRYMKVKYMSTLGHLVNPLFIIGRAPPFLRLAEILVQYYHLYCPYSVKAIEQSL